MKKLFVALFATIFTFGSATVCAAGGHKDGGSKNQNPESGAVGISGSTLESPRGSGMERLLGDEEGHEENEYENFSSSKKPEGGWSNQNEDKASDD